MNNVALAYTPGYPSADMLARGLYGRCKDPYGEARRLLRERDGWQVQPFQIHDRLLNPSYMVPEDVELTDIARALSHICRFGGHVTSFYSVASHSIHVSRLVPEELRLPALLHDATEAYLGGDIQGPLKHSRLLDGYRDLELYVSAIIALRFDIRISEIDYAEIKRADEQALYDEAHVILHFWPLEWSRRHLPSDLPIHSEPPYDAQLSFLARFTTLTAGMDVD
jgi:hypothetical protein